MKFEKYKNQLSYPHRLECVSDEACRSRRKAYNDEGIRLYDLFKKDALEECKLTDHPKADKIFAYAWEKGHSAGFHEVFLELQDLAELFLVD